MSQLIPDESVRRVQLLGDAESSWIITPLQNLKMFWNLKCCLQVKRVPPFSKWLYGARKNIHPRGRTNCCSILFAHPIKIQLDKYINVVKQRQHIRHYFLYLFICPLWWHFGPEAVGFLSYYNICTRKQHIQKMKMKKKSDWLNSWANLRSGSSI